MSRLRCAVAAATLAALSLSCTGPEGTSREADPVARGAILFIGDGMGASQLTLGRIAAERMGRPYNFDRFESVGLVATHSADELVTDSAAAATALASGVKTDNLVVGLLPDGASVETVMELAHREGLATGLIATSRITHATPACFVAHIGHRDEERSIARQMAEADVPDLLIGGGAKFFDASLRAAMSREGRAVVTSTAELGDAIDADRVVALIAEDHVPFRIDGGPSLVDLVEWALDFLRPRGRFLLVVEGARIDHACHYHDAAAAAAEQLDFDAAIGLALDRAEEWGDVLVTVTADHATGNLGISEDADPEAMLEARASAEKVGSAIAEAPREKRHRIAGRSMTEAWGFEPEDDELEVVLSREDLDWYRMAAGHFASRRYGFEFYAISEAGGARGKTIGHDGALVPLFASGPHADSFRGVLDNTEVGRRLADALDLPRLAERARGHRRP